MPPDPPTSFGIDPVHSLSGGTAGLDIDALFSLCMLVPEGSIFVHHMAGNQIARPSETHSIDGLKVVFYF